MTRHRLLPSALVCIVAGCMTEVPGDPGQAGPPGEQGPPGPGAGLVWKDSTGMIVPDAFPLYQDRRFAMLVRDANGVFFDVSPMSGVFNYTSVTTGNGVQYFLTSNCSGPAQVLLDVAPNMAFQLDGRVIALPTNIPVTTQSRSYYNSTGCHDNTYVSSYVPSDTLANLPTLTPPTLRPGPYHVEPR